MKLKGRMVTGWEEEGFGSNKEESRERWPDRGRSGAGNGHFNHFYNHNIFFFKRK